MDLFTVWISIFIALSGEFKHNSGRISILSHTSSFDSKASLCSSYWIETPKSDIISNECSSVPRCGIGGELTGLGSAKLANVIKFCKFLAGSFSAVSKRNFARKYAFDSIFQALQDLHTFAPLQSQKFSKQSVWKISNFRENSATFFANVPKCCKVCKFCQISKISAR